MSELMATMVTKPCKHKPSATLSNPNASILLPKYTRNEVADGAVSTTVNGFSPINLECVYELGLDGEWTLLSDSNTAEVGVLDISEDEIIALNSSNNNKATAGRTKIIVRNSWQTHNDSTDHVSTSLPRNYKLKPMKNNLDRGSVNSIKPRTANDEGLSDNADCGKDFNRALYPEIADVQLGATEFMSAMGMRPLVCPFGYMEHKSGPELSLSFVISLSCLISTNFSWRSKQTQKCNEYLFQILEKHQLTFRLRFPYQGLYTLEIYAQKKSASDPPKNVFNYIIHAPNPVAESILPFPTAHKDWHVAGFLLKEPLDGVLPSNSQSTVGVRVLRALSVFVTSGGTSFDLKEHEGAWWIGLINTGVAGSEIGLHAVFTAEPRSSVPLLSFRAAPTTAEGKTTVDISAFEEEIVAIERKRLQQLLNSNRDWLKKILEEEEKYSKDTISAHKARLLRLSTNRKTEHTKQRRKLKPNQTKRNLPLLFGQELKALEKLRNDCRKRLADIRKLESETIASIEAGGKKAIEEIRKSLSSLLQGMNIPQEKVSERLTNHMKLLAELDGIQAELFSKNTWMEESLGEISNVHRKLVSAVADLQRSTYSSLGLAVKELKEEEVDAVVEVVSVMRELSEREILNRMENMEHEALKEMTDEAKAYVDMTAEMKHESIKQIYSLQIKEMQRQDAWVKAREMRVFELLQISSPPSDIAKYLQTEIEEATDDCKKRLLALREEVIQQSQYLQDVYKESLFKFQLSEQEKLKEYERKLETTLAALCAAVNENLLRQHSAKPREIVLRLEGHLTALIAEIGIRDLNTFLTIRDAIASSVFEELDQTQAHMLHNTASVVSMDTSGKQVVKTEIMKDLDPVKTESWKHASKVLLSDPDTGKITPKPRRFSVPRKPRKMSDNQELLRLLSAQESKKVEEVDEKSLDSEESLSDASKCSFLILGKSEDCKDSVLKLIEESTEHFKQTGQQKRSDDLITTQRLMTKAVLRIEDVLTAETKDILTYIIKEVYDNYKETMAALKKTEEERLLQVRRVKRDSMFEMKEWLKNRFMMMVAHDVKTTGKLKNEIRSMIDEMERLGNRRVACIKTAFDNNKAKIKKHYEDKAITKAEKEELHKSDVIGHIKTLYNETVAELESKVKSCYKSIKKKALAEFDSIEIDEQIKSNECKERVLERFWGNVRDGERDVVSDLQWYCILKEREEAEVAHDCINGEEETMDLIKTDLMKKCADIDRSETRIRTESRKVEENRLDEIGGIVKDSPWLWSEIKKDEDDRLMEKRIYDEERLFEQESKQEEALESLMASREMSNSQVENKFREKHARLRKEFLTKGSDYVTDVFLTGKVRNIQEKILVDIQKIHKEMVIHMKMNDHRTFRDMRAELNKTFERISTEYQNMYRSISERQTEIYEPIRILEEQIRTSNRVELPEDDVDMVTKEMKENLFRVLELREKTHLRGWLDTVASNGLDDALRQDVISVDMIVKSLDHIDVLRNQAMSLDIRKMRKVLTRFQTPNHTIHEGLKGILLTLGDHEGITGEWKNCMRRITPIGRMKLKWRVKKFFLKELDPRIAKRAMDILSEVPFDQVDEISPEVLTYCSWAWAVCEERLEMATRGGSRAPEPANLHEQIQIFKRKYHSKGPVAGPRVLLFDTEHSINQNTVQMVKKKTIDYRSRLSDVNDGKYYKDY